MAAALRWIAVTLLMRIPSRHSGQQLLLSSLQRKGLGSARHTGGNDHPGRVEPSIIDPKIQELGSAVHETLIFLIHVAR